MGVQFTSGDKFHPVWDSLPDLTLRPTLMVIRDGTGFRPIDLAEFSSGTSGGGGGSTTTNGQVGITGSNGQAIEIIDVGGTKAFPVAIVSGQTIVSGANINLTGTQNIEQPIDYAVFTPLGFNGSITTRDWASFSVISSFFVPSGKELKIDGYGIRAVSTGIHFLSAVREFMYGYSQTGGGSPPAPVLSGRTIFGYDGLTSGATYNYRTVICNHIGRSAAGPSIAITLTGTQNAVDWKQSILVSGTLLQDNSYYEIYRSPANGGSGSERFLAATPNILFQDAIPDSELGADLPPAINSFSGVITGYAYPSGQAPRHVILETYSGPGDINIVYKNLYKKTRMLFLDAFTVGTVPNLEISQTTGMSFGVSSIPNRRPPRLVDGHEWDNNGISEIVHVGQSGISGNYAIYGYNPIFYINADAGASWSTQFFPKTLNIPAGKEVVISVGSTLAITSNTRVDLIIYGRLV